MVHDFIGSAHGPGLSRNHANREEQGDIKGRGQCVMRDGHIDDVSDDIQCVRERIRSKKNPGKTDQVECYDDTNRRQKV
jgi:hypothetical protein